MITPPVSIPAVTERPEPKPRTLLRRVLPGRFEMKLLAALALATVLPAAAAYYLVELTVQKVTDVATHHQQEVRTSLSGAAELYRSYFADRKEDFRERAAEIAAAAPGRLADLAGVPDLLRARVYRGAALQEEWSAPPDVIASAREAPPNLVELPAVRPGEPRVLELTFGIPQETYDNFLALRQAIDREHDLGKALPLAMPMIFRGLGLALLLVLAVALVLGSMLARRATRRVAALSDAARRVGEGDLSVRVTPRGNDELDDLARSFNAMVVEVREARSRLEYLQKVSAWQEVARRLAHEIKNPLTPIQLSVQELVSKYDGGDPRYRRLLDTASEILKEEIGSLRRLVDDFSAFAKLPKVEPVPVDLGAVVEDFVRSRPEWQSMVELNRPANPVSSLCDRMMIRRVLANLVENAVQAAEGAQRAPQVRITVARVAAADGGPAAACIAVDDNGPGVPPNERAHIFDPYFTTKESGTGLGLAIVRKIVIDHGGDIGLVDQPSELGGARFVVQLPSGEPRDAPRATRRSMTVHHAG